MKTPAPRWDRIKFLVLDFDGVLTDGYAYVGGDGEGLVRVSRRDSHGIRTLLKNHIGVAVITLMDHAIPKARCKRLGMGYYFGENKAVVLVSILKEKGIDPENVCFMGDDIPDIECIQMAGIGVAVADAEARVIQVADHVTERSGGCHAVREVCDHIIAAQKNRGSD